MESHHTPTPWEIGASQSSEAAIYSCDEQVLIAPVEQWIGECAAESEANAAFIVRACNAHDVLVSLIERLTDSYALVIRNINQMQTAPDYAEGLIIESRAALKLAGEN